MKYAVGIDPDKGLAIWDCEYKKYASVETTCFWDIHKTLAVLAGNQDSEPCVVYIEAPHLNRPVWHRGTNSRTQGKIDQNVGENKGKAKLIIEDCRNLGLPVVECKPSKQSMTKLDAAEFGRITGWRAPTSEHGRDAAMLVLGR